MLKSGWATPLLAAALLAIPAASASADCPGNPNALGVARTVEIDTQGGPGFGFEHFKDYDFLKQGEIVLTFDDGPWPTTPQVLKELTRHCTKAMFFVIGKHTTYHPEILRQVVIEGHTVGTHTWSHADLSNPKLDEAKRIAEIEMGISAARHGLGENADKLAAFFRFPALRHPPDMMQYLAKRNVAVWSTDVDSFDFKLRGGDSLVPSIMQRLAKHGKGILLMHDFQKNTAAHIGQLLDQLKAGNYKIVQVKAGRTVKSLPEFDAMVKAQVKGPVAGDSRPLASVVKTVDEAGKK